MNRLWYIRSLEAIFNYLVKTFDVNFVFLRYKYSYPKGIQFLCHTKFPGRCVTNKPYTLEREMCPYFRQYLGPLPCLTRSSRPKEGEHQVVETPTTNRKEIFF